MNNNPNDYVTWVYSDEGDNKGWMVDFILIRGYVSVNSKFFSFKKWWNLRTQSINRKKHILWNRKP
jgi:hypothetical protein